MAIFPLSHRRGWWLVMFAGLASFAASFGALIVFAAGWAAAVIPTISETVPPHPPRCRFPPSLR